MGVAIRTPGGRGPLLADSGRAAERGPRSPSRSVNDP